MGSDGWPGPQVSLEEGIVTSASYLQSLNCDFMLISLQVKRI